MSDILKWGWGGWVFAMATTECVNPHGKGIQSCCKDSKIHCKTVVHK